MYLLSKESYSFIFCRKQNSFNYSLTETTYDFKPCELPYWTSAREKPRRALVCILLAFSFRLLSMLQPYCISKLHVLTCNLVKKKKKNNPAPPKKNPNKIAEIKRKHTTRSPQQQPPKQTYTSNYYALYPIKIRKSSFNF